MKQTLSIILFQFSVIVPFAQTKVNNELKTLINQSFSYFPKIKEVENIVATAQDKVALTELNKSPEVAYEASYNYVKPKIEIPFPMGPNGSLVNFQFAPVNNVATDINASYALFDFGRMKATIQKSKDELQYAQHNVDLIKNQLAAQVATVYYNIVFLKKAISIEDSVLNFLNDNKVITESKLQNGDALKIDLLNIKATIDAEQNKKVDLENSLQKQLNLLAYTTNTNQSSDTNFDFDINLIDTASSLLSAQINNVEFVLAKDKIKQAKSDLSIAMLTDKPYIGVHAAAGVKNGYVPDVNAIRFNYIAGIFLSVPIYNGGKTKQQIKLQEHLIKQNELAVESLNNNYKKDIAQAITDIKSNYERISNMKGQIEQTIYAEQLAGTRYKDGVGTNLELTNASTNVERAELTKLQYEYQLCLAKLELAKIMGYQYW